MKDEFVDDVKVTIIRSYMLPPKDREEEIRRACKQAKLNVLANNIEKRLFTDFYTYTKGVL